MNIDSLLGISILGFVAGAIGTGLGGFTAFILEKPSDRLYSFVMGFSGGLMISIVCFDLLPEAFLSGIHLAILGIVMGVLLISFLDQILTSFSEKYNYKNDYLKAGILLGLGIAVHNFPEGLAIGSGLAANPSLGLSLAMIILIHDIPEGMAMAAPLSISGMSKYKVLLYTMFAGLPMGLGAFVGGYVGNISDTFIGVCLGFAGGAMLYITCQEIIPKASAIWKGRTSGYATIFGIICGIILANVL